MDAAIHAVAILASLAGTLMLLQMASARGAFADVVAVAVYSTGLLAMLGCSCAYNLARSTRHCDVLRCLDNSAIFLMIAGTYTPFTLLNLQGAWSMSLTGAVWGVAAAGIVIRVLYACFFDRVYICLYMALGWIGIVGFTPLFHSLDPLTLKLLLVGGLLYSIGVVFHLWEQLPFHRAIWHGFVVCAAATHYAAVIGRWA